MKKGDTRGLSTIVATLLIILLTLVAVGIIWAVVRNVLNNNAQQISLGKFTVDLEIVAVYPSNGTTDTGVKVKRNAGEGELEGIIFSVFDGKQTHTFEENNVSLNPLEMKTFFVDYQGKIVSLSIYPIFATSSGKTTTGNIADTYSANSGNDYISSNCTSTCLPSTECGDNGCGGVCGTCSGSTPNCNSQGQCTSNPVGQANCSCQTTTCIGTTCSDGIGGNCDGILQPDCNNNQIMCGPSLNGCGINCGNCDTGYFCNGGICSQTCSHSDCNLRECGGLPGRTDCGATFCGICSGLGETCNETSGQCEVCQPNCGLRNCGVDPVCGSSCGLCNATLGETCNMSTGICFICQPQCGTKKCGIDPVCGSSCGTCDTAAGEYCNLYGNCVKDEVINTGTVYSIWPLDVGAYFDSNDLPKVNGIISGGYWVKIPGGTCLQIDRFVIPIVPEVYNKSYIKFLTSSSTIHSGDNYEIWEKYSNCIR
jgi:hypothetical protein